MTAHAPSAPFLRHTLARVRQLGIVGAGRALAARARAALWSADSLVVFRIDASQVRAVPAEVEDSERWTYRSSAVTEITREARTLLPRNLAAALDEAPDDQRVHRIDVDGHVAAWGFSIVPAGGWPLWETGSTLTVEEGAVCLLSFETLPAYRGRRLYPTIMQRILAERFTEGATAGYIWCRPTNAASYAAIKRVGFQEMSVHRSVRILGFGRHREHRLRE